MAKEVMRRSAADNEYLHRDFHGALSAGVQYVQDRYGGDAVREFLRQFTLSYYAPLRRELMERGLAALKEHFERIYSQEGGEIRVERSEDELVIRVQACPAVTHMREHGYHVADMFAETTRTVNEALCAGSPFLAETRDYDEQTGACVMTFRRAQA